MQLHKSGIQICVVRVELQKPCPLGHRLSLAFSQLATLGLIYLNDFIRKHVIRTQ